MNFHHKNRKTNISVGIVTGVLRSLLSKIELDMIRKIFFYRSRKCYPALKDPLIRAYLYMYRCSNKWRSLAAIVVLEVYTYHCRAPPFISLQEYFHF